MHILLAEDDENDAILIQRAFKKVADNVVVTIFRNGQEVMDYLQGVGKFSDRAQYPLPNLLMLDLKMPCRNGFEVLEWVKTHADFRRIPTVLLSSSRQQRDVVRAYDLKANSYLVKPTAFPDLLTIAQTLAAYWLKVNLPSTSPACA